MKISAVIPAYNCARHIGRAIESALKQTHPVAEIVVIDDGSTDETPDVVERFGAPVRYIRQANAGVSAARNHGVEVAASPWVALLDSDDWWLPQKIERQVEALERAPDAVLAYTGVWFAEGDKPWDPAPIVSAAELWPSLRYRNAVSTSSVVVRRDVVLGAGGFSRAINHCEDWDLWVRLRQRYAFTNASERLTVFESTPASLSTDIDKMLSGTRRILEPTLLVGIEGWRRMLWRRRVWSAQLYGASVMAREMGSPREGPLLRQSLRHWPSPAFQPERWLDLARNVLGTSLYDGVSRRLKPGTKQAAPALGSRAGRS